MKALIGLEYVTKGDNKKGYNLPDPLDEGQPRRVVDERTLHNPEWLVDFDKSTINQDFIAEVVEKSMANLLVSHDDEREYNTS